MILLQTRTRRARTGDHPENSDRIVSPTKFTVTDQKKSSSQKTGGEKNRSPVRREAQGPGQNPARSSAGEQRQQGQTKEESGGGQRIALFQFYRDPVPRCRPDTILHLQDHPPFVLAKMA